jgi:hypothetical protein
MGESEHPRHGVADHKARAIRARALELLADAATHAERINAAAARLGLTPDLVEGLGDHLYEAAVAQLDVASKILERSQAIVDRLFELGARQLEPSRLVRIDVGPGRPAQVRFVVRNAAPEAAIVEVDATWDGAGELVPRIGRTELAGGRETAVEIAIAGDRLRRGQVFAGTATPRLRYQTGRTIALPRHDFEIWVAE